MPNPRCRFVRTFCASAIRASVFVTVLFTVCFSAESVAGAREALARCNARRLPSAMPVAVGMWDDLRGDIAALLVWAKHRGLFRKAVLLVVRNGKVVSAKTLGVSRDAIFDLASLTKVVATLPCVIDLRDHGKLLFSDRLGERLKWLANTDKASIRVGQLLDHTSALPSVVWAGPKTIGSRRWLSDESVSIKARIQAAQPLARTGQRYRYSDVGYILAGWIVEGVAGKSLDVYAKHAVFAPIGMCDTGFVPSQRHRDRLVSPWPQGGNLGIVYDPLALRLNGVAGHAGLFGTADDLALFGQMLLDGGGVGEKQVLAASSVEALFRLRVRHGDTRRTLGWRAERSESGKQLTIGHTGFTGSWLSIDKENQTVIVLLTDRTYKEPAPSHSALRRTISNVVAAAAAPRIRRSLDTGLDQWVRQGFSALRGQRVGVIVNQTAVDRHGRFIANLLAKAPNVKLSALFVPEHGLKADREGSIGDGNYTIGNVSVPMYGLFGKRRGPSDEALRGIDTLLFDIQTVGVRFYTYIATLGWALEAAARHGLRFVVLDRPNPLGGRVVTGPVSRVRKRTATNYFPLPVRHGMTVGELARMMNDEMKIGARLEVISMRGWQRNSFIDAYKHRWIKPSPNLRNGHHALLYAGVGLVEGTNVSVGRGTDSPFVVVGAPWIDADALAARLNRSMVAGVFAVPASFMPRANPYRNKLCHGVRMLITDRARFRPVLLGIHLATVLHRLYPKQWDMARLNDLVRHEQTVAGIRKGWTLRRITHLWRAGLSHFEQKRVRYLLY